MPRFTIYLEKEENEYLIKVSEEDFMSKNSYIRKLVKEDKERRADNEGKTKRHTKNNERKN